MDRFHDDARDQQIEALGNYRDALLAGHPPEELQRLTASLDPALLRLVQQMHTASLHHLPQPEPEFARELEQMLRQEIGRVAAVPPLPHFSPNGHATGIGQPEASSVLGVPPRAATPWGRLFIAAALVLLVVLGGWAAVRQFFPSSATTVLNAAHGPSMETLVEGAIEGAPESWTPMSVERWTFQPGQATLSIPVLDGPQWVVADSAPLVLTIDGIEETLPAGAGMMIPAGVELVVSNPGTTVLSVYRGVATAGFALEEYDRNLISRRPALDTEAHEAIPPGTSRIVFERVTLFPGTTLLLEPASGQDWLGIVSGKLGVTLLGDGLPLNWRSGHEREIAGGESLPALVPGTRVTLRNIGDDPLILLRLRVLPTAGAARASTASDRLENTEGVE